MNPKVTKEACTMAKETNIRVSLDVFKALEGVRQDFEEDHDAILRRVLQLAEPATEERPPTRSRRRVDIPEAPTAPSGAAKVDAGEASWSDREVTVRGEPTARITPPPPPRPEAAPGPY